MKKKKLVKKSRKLKLKLSTSLLAIAFLIVGGGYAVAYNFSSNQVKPLLPHQESSIHTEINLADQTQAKTLTDDKPATTPEPSKQPADTKPEQAQSPPKAPEAPKKTAPVIKAVQQTPPPTPPANIGGSAETASSLSFINSLRASLGKSALTQNATMDQWALAHATKLASECALYHQNISNFLNQNIGPITIKSIAENVGYAPTTMQVLENLKNSPGHYANMTGDYSYVGLGIANGSGTCTGYVYTTQMFAK